MYFNASQASHYVRLVNVPIRCLQWVLFEPKIDIFIEIRKKLRNACYDLREKSLGLCILTSASTRE